jgi:GAF domain-containing protein/HAMP domain-containing protein
MSKRQARKKSRTPLEVLNDIPVAGKLLVLVLIPLGITFGVTLLLIVNGLNQLEADTSTARLKQEERVISQEFTQLQNELSAEAARLSTDSAVLEAAQRGDQDTIAGLLLKATIQTPYLSHAEIVDGTGQSLGIKGKFEVQGGTPELERLNKLGLLRVATTELVWTDQGWLLTVVQPLTPPTGQVEGVLTLGTLLNEPTLYELNFGRSDPRVMLFDAEGNPSAISQHHLKGSVDVADAECQACHQDAAVLSNLKGTMVSAAQFPLDKTLWEQAQSGQVALGQTQFQDRVLRVAYAPLQVGGKSPAVFGLLLSTKAAEDLRNQLLLTSLAVAFLVVVLAALSAVVLGRRSIAQPLVRVAAGAQQITGGQLDVVVPGADRQDEIGALAATFNSMTARLRGVIDSLEARSVQLKASAEVSRAVTSVLDPDDLVRQVTQLIAERFNFYYAAIFLINETGQFAVLREATGEAGQELKKRNHQLQVGGASMVGYVTAQRKARVAADVSQETARFANPLLPDTRSEIALPLMVAGRVIGALDVQATEVGAFDEGMVAVLQGLVDQVAIALNNAREFQNAQLNAQQSLALFEASQGTMDISEGLTPAVSRLLGTVTQRANFDAGMAASFDAAGQTYTIITTFDANQVKPVEDVSLTVTIKRSDMPAALAIQAREPIIINAAASDPRLSPPSAETLSALGKSISVPAMLGDRVLGVITLSRSLDKPDISDREAQLIQVVASQLAATIENHRLLDQAQAATAEVNDLIRRYTREGWSKYAETRPGALLERHYSQPGADSLDPDIVHQIEDIVRARPDKPSGLARLGLAGVPIMLRGEVLGTIGLQADPDHPFTADELATVRAVADQVAQSIEAARLLEGTERLAQRERSINEINARVRQTIDLDAILRTAVNELGQSLKAARVTARINVADNDQSSRRSADTGDQSSRRYADTGSQPDAAGSPRGNDHD